MSNPPKLTYYPSRLPDELLYSRLARYRLHTCTSDRQASLDLFGSAYAGYSIRVPSGLGHLADRLPTPRTPIEIAVEETLFPYYTHYASNQQYFSILQEMTTSTRVGLSGRTGISRLRGGSSTLRWCANCQASSLEHFGEMYWRRTHQLPGVLVCADHRLPLFELTLPTSTPRFVAASPRVCTTDGHLPEWASDPVAFELALKVATLSDHVLTSERRSFIPPARYKFLLNKAGFFLNNKDVDHHTLFSACDRVFAPVKHLIPELSNSFWIRKLLNQNEPMLSPIFHILFRIFFAKNMTEPYYTGTIDGANTQRGAVQSSSSIRRTNGVVRSMAPPLIKALSMTERNSRVSREFTVIDVLLSGRDASEARSVTGLSLREIENIRAMYNELGPASLLGSDSFIKAFPNATLIALCEIVKDPPYDGGRWKVESLTRVLSQRLERSISREMVGRALVNLGKQWW